MQKKRKEKRRDSRVWKRFLDTIIQQLPSYIVKYPQTEQVLLNEFLAILKDYNVDIVTNRDKLYEKLRVTSQTYRNDDRYLQVPFLWFVVDYLENASRLLGVTDFYAEDFYEYLVSSLRGDSRTLGAFHLLRDTFSLTDHHWEDLQYACYTPRPLNDNELQILSLVYSLISNAQVEVLDQYKLMKVISSQVPAYATHRSISKFFTALNCIWTIYFNFDCIDLCRVYFLIRLDSSTTLAEVIDFNDQINTTLTTSYVYQVQNIPNVYVGLITVPKGLIDCLNNLFKEFQHQGKIKTYHLEKIDDVRASASLVQYRRGKGWQSLSNSKWKQIVGQLITSNPRRHKKSIESFFVTPSLNHNWNYLKYDSPSQIINLFCKAYSSYTFKNLPFGSNNDNISPQFSKTELNLLRKLYRAKIAFIAFYPSSLVSEFSLERYWIKTPKIPLFQLSQLLAFLPFNQIYITGKQNYLWTILTPELVKRIESDLKWEIMPIIDVHKYQRYSTKWFDSTELLWKKPEVLSKKKGMKS